MKTTPSVSDFYFGEADDDGTFEEVCENHEIQYVKGRGYYKVEKKTTAKSNKKIVIRDVTTGEIKFGDDAKNKLGVSTSSDFIIDNIHLRSNEVFIQSTSSNRILKSGDVFVYEVGKNNFYTYMNDNDGSIISGKRVVVFGTDSEIENGCLCCGVNVPEEIYDNLEGDGSSCESYAIITEKDYDFVKVLCESFGYVENEKLKECGWG